MFPLILVFLVSTTQNNLYANAQKFSDLPVDEIFTDEFDQICGNGFSLQLSHYLNHIPEKFLNSSSLVCLDFSGSTIRGVDSNIFNGLPNLKYVKFRGGSFDLNPLFRDGHDKLEILVLEAIQQPIPEKEFHTNYSNFHSWDYLDTEKNVTVAGEFPKLRKLILASSKFDRLKIKSNLPSLTHLDLSNTGITTDQVKWWPRSLEYLNLQNTSSTNPELQGMLNLKWFSMSLQYGHTLQPNRLGMITLTDLPNLEHLSLSSCGINSYIHIFIKNLKNLKSVDLSKNKLNIFPLDTLIEAPSLQFLNLSGNVQLTQIFSKNSFSHLTDVDLSNTRIHNLEWLTGSMKKLIFQNSSIRSTALLQSTPSLQYVDLSYNKITHIERTALENMKNLRYLNLSRNFIMYVDSEAFDDLLDLEVLHLENNGIADFPKITQKLKLHTLIMNCNKLKVMTSGMFVNLESLKNLFLHNNFIDEIEPGAFAGLKFLETLTLSYNRLTNLPEEWSLPISDLQTLDLSGNPFLSLNSLQLNPKSSLKNLYLSSQFTMLEYFAIKNLPENVTIYIDPKQGLVQPGCSEKIHESEYQY